MKIHFTTARVKFISYLYFYEIIISVLVTAAKFGSRVDSNIELYYLRQRESLAWHARI